ncbi:hypothetical protein INT43_005817 [Umbelopsis isabellina]|uniref:Uncharacterized protein n=1 Tax=Mortierella isabellina TaxID=91625 RepID=A0A8H7UCR0_MORIS|nr:hypothetical protein INT43_005817 [Umbelopsis isabellina]
MKSLATFAVAATLATSALAQAVPQANNAMPADMAANIKQKVNERVQNFKGTQQIQNAHIQNSGNRMENHMHYGNNGNKHHRQGDPYPMPTVVRSATDIVSATLSGGRPARTEVAIEVKTIYKYDFVTVTETVTAEAKETEKPYHKKHKNKEHKKHKHKHHHDDDDDDDHHHHHHDDHHGGGGGGHDHDDDHHHGGKGKGKKKGHFKFGKKPSSSMSAPSMATPTSLVPSHTSKAKEWTNPPKKDWQTPAAAPSASKGAQAGKKASSASTARVSGYLMAGAAAAAWFLL